MISECLARGQDHVRVVRQEQDFVGADLLDRVEQLARRRVVRLAAVHDRGNSVRIEDAAESVARRNRYDGQRHGSSSEAASAPFEPDAAVEPDDAILPDAFLPSHSPGDRPRLRTCPDQRAAGLRWALRGRGSSGRATVSAARFSRTSCDCDIQVLDRDPRQRAHRQAERDDVVRPLVVDMDLDGSRVARDEYRVAHRSSCSRNRSTSIGTLPDRSRNIVS